MQRGPRRHKGRPDKGPPWSPPHAARPAPPGEAPAAIHPLLGFLCGAEDGGVVLALVVVKADDGRPLAPPLHDLGGQGRLRGVQNRLVLGEARDGGADGVVDALEDVKVRGGLGVALGAPFVGDLGGGVEGEVDEIVDAAPGDLDGEKAPALPAAPAHRGGQRVALKVPDGALLGCGGVHGGGEPLAGGDPAAAGTQVEHGRLALERKVVGAVLERVHGPVAALQRHAPGRGADQEPGDDEGGADAREERLEREDVHHGLGIPFWFWREARRGRGGLAGALAGLCLWDKVHAEEVE
eukprot:CAMPEP_0173421782 /NCGR_PEP_ID=MMETSP1357-20121228/2754_1 /TAXON_ID=77926 /ORGANISM="Hemiselmis rufescens, Strain PCC563" /LENGTH=295 /DNA_ID=CAMNT_0014384731 /DNA_START=23 /DNA_END=910 /DNA_ORIENTATION=+